MRVSPYKIIHTLANGVLVETDEVMRNNGVQDVSKVKCMGYMFFDRDRRTCEDEGKTRRPGVFSGATGIWPL